MISKASKQEAALRQGRASNTDDAIRRPLMMMMMMMMPTHWQPRRSCESVRCRKPLLRGS